MLLAVDVGNTQTVLGLFEGERLADSFRLATDRSRTGDELGVTLAALQPAARTSVLFHRPTHRERRARNR
jgi:type III pantothenate kinase